MNFVSYIAPPIIGALSYYKYTGDRNALIKGAMFGLADIAIKYFDLSKHNYFSWFTTGLSLTKATLPNASIQIHYGVALPVAIIGAQQEEIFAESGKEFLAKAQDIGQVFEKIIGTNQFNKYLVMHASSAIASQFLVQTLANKMSSAIQTLAFQRTHMGEYSQIDQQNNSKDLYNKFIKSCAVVVPWIFSWSASNLVNGLINTYFSYRLSSKASTNLNDMVFAEDKILMLSQNSTETDLLMNSQEELAALSGGAPIVIFDTLTSITNGVFFGLIPLYNKHIDIAAYSLVYSKVFDIIGAGIKEKLTFYDDKLKPYGATIKKNLASTLDNVESIVEQESLGYQKEFLADSYLAKQNEEYWQNIWRKIDDSFMFVKVYTGIIFSIFLTANKLYKGNMEFEETGNIFTQVDNLKEALSTFASNGQQMNFFKNSLKSINTLLDRMEKIEQEIQTKYNVSREYDENIDKVFIPEFQLGFDGVSLIKAHNLSIELNKKYGVVGPSGSGKSLFLSHIAKPKYDGAEVSGKVVYPLIGGEKPKVTMMSQHPYFPLDKSLLDVIFNPSPVIDSQVNKVKEWLKEVSIYEKPSPLNILDRLNQTEKWTDVLSGGQKKKISLISTILKKPDIVVFDEVFSGMDPSSASKTQKFIGKHLPNSTIIIVDHNIGEHYSFYDKVLCIENKTISECDLPNRTEEETIFPLNPIESLPEHDY